MERGRTFLRKAPLSLVTASAMSFIAFAVLPAVAQATPPVVTGYYMSASSFSGLRQEAWDAGCSFARNNPGGYRLLMLDFGAARNVGSEEGAEDLNKNPVTFDNNDIEYALKSASDGAHSCHNGQGTNVIAYGNSNDCLGVCGGMSDSDVYNVGYDQEYRANDVWNYEQDNGRIDQGVAAGSDMELSWDGPTKTDELIHGANDYPHSLYYDYGDANSCPPVTSSCYGAWTVDDVEYASFGGQVAVPMPEIYYYPGTVQEWTNIRQSWDASHSTNYQFWGVTGTSGVGLTPQEGWDDLSNANPGWVMGQPGIISMCFCG